MSSNRAPVTMTRAQELRDRMLCAEDDEEVTTDEVDAMRRAHREVDALRASLDAAEGKLVEWKSLAVKGRALNERDEAMWVEVVESSIRRERTRCAGVVSWAAHNAREARRTRVAAELNLLARDILDYREAT